MNYKSKNGCNPGNCQRDAGIIECSITSYGRLISLSRSPTSGEGYNEHEACCPASSVRRANSRPSRSIAYADEPKKSLSISERERERARARARQLSNVPKKPKEIEKLPRLQAVCNTFARFPLCFEIALTFFSSIFCQGPKHRDHAPTLARMQTCSVMAAVGR